MLGTVNDVFDGVLCLAQRGVNLAVVGEEEALDVVPVEVHGAIVDGAEAPDEEDNLSEPVEGEPTEEPSAEEVKEAEERKDYPVCEPLHVVVRLMCLQGGDGLVGGVDEADQVADQLGKVPEDHVEGEEAKDALSDVDPLDAGERLNLGGVVVDRAGRLQVLVDAVDDLLVLG